jgi:hypothetical protein
MQSRARWRMLTLSIAFAAFDLARSAVTALRDMRMACGEVARSTWRKRDERDVMRSRRSRLGSQ